METQGRPICPICREPIRVSAIFNWKDRVIKSLPTKRAIATGMVSGLALKRELKAVSLGIGSGLAVSGLMGLVKRLFENCCPSLNFREVTGTALGGLTGICGTIILYSKFIGWEGTMEKFSKEIDELSENRMRIPTSPLLIQAVFTLGSLGAWLGNRIGELNDPLVNGAVEGTIVGIIGTFFSEGLDADLSMLGTAALAGGLFSLILGSIKMPWRQR